MYKELLGAVAIALTLIAFFPYIHSIHKGQTKPQPGEIRSQIASILPDYMVPTAYVFLDQFPLLPFGKVNRRALPAPDNERPDLGIAYQPPETPLQTAVAEAFAGVLQLDRVGIHDDFFALGGDSLLATQLMGQLHAEFQLDLSLVQLFETPTVATITHELIKKQAAALSDQELDEILAELDGLDEDEIERLLDSAGINDR